MFQVDVRLFNATHLYHTFVGWLHKKVRVA